MAGPDLNAAFDTYASSIRPVADPNEAFDRFAGTKPKKAPTTDPNAAFDNFARSANAGGSASLRPSKAIQMQQTRKTMEQRQAQQEQQMARARYLAPTINPMLGTFSVWTSPLVQGALNQGSQITAPLARDLFAIERPEDLAGNLGPATRAGLQVQGRTATQHLESIRPTGTNDALDNPTLRKGLMGMVGPMGMIASDYVNPADIRQGLKNSIEYATGTALTDGTENLGPLTQRGLDRRGQTLDQRAQQIVADELAQTSGGIEGALARALPVPASAENTFDVATAAGMSPEIALATEAVMDPGNIIDLGPISEMAGVGRRLARGLGSDDLAEAFARGVDDTAAELGRNASMRPPVPKRGKTTAQLQRELRQAQAAEDEALEIMEDDRFSYEPDVPEQPVQNPLKSKSIAQMRAEMRNPLPPPPGPKSAGQLRAEMARDPNEAFDAFSKTLPEMNPDLPAARPIQNELREAAHPQRELSRPALSMDEMEDLRSLPDVEYAAPARDPNEAFDEFSKLNQAAPAPAPKPEQTAPEATPKPDVPAWQRPTPKNVSRWQKTVSEADAQLEARVRKAVAEAGGEESSWRAHYREMEPESVKFARANLATAQVSAPAPAAPAGPIIDPATWERSSAPGAVKVKLEGRTMNVPLSSEELASWRWQTPAERRQAIEARALAAKPAANVPTYRPPAAVGEDDIAREMGFEGSPRQTEPGRQLREFRERRAAEQPPTPEQEARAAERGSLLDEFNRRSLELVPGTVPVPTGKGRLKAGPLERDDAGRPFVDMGQRRYWLTEGEAKYYNDLPPEVDKTEWLKLRQHEPKAPRYRAANALPEGQAEIPEAAVDELIPAGSPLKGKPVRSKPAEPEAPRTLVDEFLEPQGPRVGLDFEPDAPTGKPATGWDSPRAPETIGKRRLTAEQKDKWPWMTAAERKEMMGAKPGPKVGMDFAPEQLELGYKVAGQDVKLGQAATIKELPVPAIVRFVKETTGSYPNVTEALRALGKRLGGTVRGRVTGRTIQLNPDLFEDVTKLAKVLAHEIGHLPDLVPWSSKGISGGVGDLRKGMRSWLKSLPADVRNELWAASKHWRPIDEGRASAQQLRYRKDVEETFADAISQLFNDPEGLQKRAPKFWKAFTEQLDKQPKLKQSIADVHAWRSGTLQDLTADLRQQIRDDMIKGADLMKALQEEALQREQSLLYRLHQNWGAVETGFLDQGGVFKAWADRLERQGLTVPEHIDPRVHYDAWQMPDGPTSQVAKHANERILQPLREANIDEHLAGEWLQNQAIADGHRAKVANPRGVTEKEAREALRQIEGQLSPDQVKTLRETAQEARSMFWDALEEAADAGRLDRATLNRLAQNKESLTPLLELDKLHESAKLEDLVSSIETGSFAEAANPLIGLVQQTLAVRGMARRNKARLAMLDFVRQFSPEDVLPATGRPRKGSTAFAVYRDGVKETHHVDRYLEDLFEVTTTRELDVISNALTLVDKYFTNFWLRYNPGFYLGQGVMDVFRSARNLAAEGLYSAWAPGNTLRVLGSYKGALGPAMDYAREVPNDVISKMIQEQAILPPDLSLANQLGGDQLGNVGQLEAVLRQAGINTSKASQQGNVLRRVAAAVDSFATKVGRFSEALPKVAAYQELERAGKHSPATRARIVRTKVGQPGGYIKGKHTRSSSRILTFSNTIVQGLRSDYHLLRRPSTRAGFAISTLKHAFTPKLLIAAAGAGLLGAELQELYAAIPDRDKRNSIPIPLGWQEGGEFGKRVNYINVPMDPTDKLFGALIYELLTGSEKEAQDRLKAAGQTVGDTVPGLNPTLSGARNLVATLFGGDPKDDFGRDVLSRDQAIAGVLPRLSGYLEWQLGEFGLPGQTIQAAIFDEDLGQKTDWAPAGIPYLSRFIKSSDGGFAEQQRAAELAEDRGKARGRLAHGSTVRELRQQYSRLQGLGKRTPQQEKAYRDLKPWHALYDQQSQWINTLESRGKTREAEAARKKLDLMSQRYMTRFQATTGKRWK